MSDEPDDQPDYSSAMDSDAILVGAYVLKCDHAELRRYVAIDLVTALQPLTKDSIPLAKSIEAFLMGKGANVRAVE